MMNSEDTIIEHGTGAGISNSTETPNDHGTGIGISNTGVAGMQKMSKGAQEISEDYRDIKPEAFYAPMDSAFLSEGWGG